ncbi:hypothetical protein R1flu_002562 [Riccia fluitans]|uniref:Uncharacterized protein n=1 Tax=Riccia fluitans TaxID=41844 RepID=A0ABD1Y9F0_9MARC
MIEGQSWEWLLEIRRTADSRSRFIWHGGYISVDGHTNTSIQRIYEFYVFLPPQGDENFCTGGCSVNFDFDFRSRATSSENEFKS